MFALTARRAGTMSMRATCGVALRAMAAHAPATPVPAGLSAATEVPASREEIYSVPKDPKDFPSLEKTMLKEDYEHVHHARSAGPTWTKINLFVTLPLLVACAFYVLPKEAEHIHHLHEHPREFVPYAHLHKRKNPYPWGDKNLFYCPDANPHPEPAE